MHRVLILQTVRLGMKWKLVEGHTGVTQKVNGPLGNQSPGSAGGAKDQTEEPLFITKPPRHQTRSLQCFLEARSRAAGTVTAPAWLFSVLSVEATARAALGSAPAVRPREGLSDREAERPTCAEYRK
jgi:hypothetical protein